jgi:hypothetical protein
MNRDRAAVSQSGPNSTAGTPLPYEPAVTEMQSPPDPSPEAWIYRADFLSTIIYHHRFARLNGAAIEIYKGDHLQLEHTFQLSHCKLSDIRRTECDVKPPGVNLFKGYVTKQIETKQLVRLTSRDSLPALLTACISAVHQRILGLCCCTGRSSLLLCAGIYPRFAPRCVGHVQYVMKIKINKMHATRPHSKLTLGFDSIDEARAWEKAINVACGWPGVDATSSLRMERSALSEVRSTASSMHTACLRGSHTAPHRYSKMDEVAGALAAV